MPPQRGILAVITSAAALLGGCMTAPVAPAPAAVAPPVAAAPVVAAPAAPCTLGGFLGLTPVCAAIGQDVTHKLAYFSQFFPCLEPPAPLLPLTDPANLASSVPAIATAAEIKKAEDLAPQKIKALEYLATIGCGGCYPGVEEAFLAGLDDCTESVRFAAVKAIHKTAGSPCVYCNHKACCSPRLRKRLMEIAFEGSPCPKEPSARVRRMARVALNACGAPPPVMPPPPADPVELIPEGPTELPPGPVPAPPVGSPPAGPVPAAPPPEPYVTNPAAPVAAVATVQQRSKLPSESNIVPSFEASPAIKADLLAQAQAQAGAEIHAGAKTPGVAAGDTVPVARNDGDVGEDELLDYYANNLDRYHRPEQVRWESASVLIEQYPSPEEARRVMEYLRDRALMLDVDRPEAFQPELITTHRHDWTTRAEIASPPVVAALFSKEAGAVSDVMTDGKRLILVHVIGHRPAGTPPFDEIADQVRADYLAEHPEGTIRPVSRETRAAVPAADEPVDFSNPFAKRSTTAVTGDESVAPVAGTDDKPIASPARTSETIDHESAAERPQPVPSSESMVPESEAASSVHVETVPAAVPPTESIDEESTLEDTSPVPRRSRAARVRL